MGKLLLLPCSASASRVLCGLCCKLGVMSAPAALLRVHA
jgi:hypothetical protein